MSFLTEKPKVSFFVDFNRKQALTLQEFYFV